VIKNAESAAQLSRALRTVVLIATQSTFGAPRRGTPRRRARELLDIIIAVDQNEKNAAAKVIDARRNNDHPLRAP
jgi:hypothetical protein